MSDELTPDQIDGDATDLIADDAVIQQRYAIQQLMSAALYREDAQRESFTQTLVREAIAQSGIKVKGEPRVAYHFGKLQHDHPGNADVQDSTCTEHCAIVDSSEEDATVVMMRVELDVVTGGDDA